MIRSMTGYGRGEFSSGGTTAIVELRSVNSRYLELVSRVPRSLSLRENEMKELVRSRVIRGKITLNATVQGDADANISVRVNKDAVKAYKKLLNDVRKTAGLKEPVNLSHFLSFSDIFENDAKEEDDTTLWTVFEKALVAAIEQLQTMRANEGREIAKDMVKRIKGIESRLKEVETLAKQKVPEERARLQERIEALVSDKRIIDTQRLELEIALLADKLDVTEECVRFRSHNKFFLEALEREEGAGRKLNFLIQEMNREANTIGSKTNDAAIAHHVVAIKDEMEKIREQLQNFE
ncbi:MAG: YicC family protein [Ignavibacteriales bacterium]|nr:YicC family protein [Ignavibacteriales bacterium]